MVTTYAPADTTEPVFVAHAYAHRGLSDERIAGLGRTFAAVGGAWSRVGCYQFRRVVSYTGETWLQAQVFFGRYSYAVDVRLEEAMYLSAGHAHFSSRSAGRGRRAHVQIIAGGR